MKLAKIVKHCRIDKPERFRLADHDPAETFGFPLDKDEVKAVLADSAVRLRSLQERLYAQDQWAVLIVFQAMDAAGKDSVIEHVMTGINPQGCVIHPFKAPSAEELDHDFLWRSAKALPQRGRIGIFNRSHYEEVLVVRVHRELLERQRLPPQLVGKNVWTHRYQDIRAFERHLVRNGTVILKFHLQISKEEQRKRFLARLDDPAKRWKFSMTDVAERERWDDYMTAYEDMIRATSTAYAPWYVVPADHKPVTWLVVAAALGEALEGLDLQFPKVAGPALAEMETVRVALSVDGGGRRGKR